MTAVEWLQNHLIVHFSEIEQQIKFKGLFVKAKRLEKQRTTEFAEDYVFKCVTCTYNGDPMPLKSAEHYYEETFENK